MPRYDALARALLLCDAKRIEECDVTILCMRGLDKSSASRTMQAFQILVHTDCACTRFSLNLDIFRKPPQQDVTSARKPHPKVYVLVRAVCYLFLRWRIRLRRCPTKTRTAFGCDSKHQLEGSHSSCHLSSRCCDRRFHLEAGCS